MKFFEFLNMWANPSRWVRVFTKADYTGAVTMLKLGNSWQDVSGNLVAEITFNATYLDDVAGCFIAEKYRKAKVFKFVVTDEGLLVFLDI